MFRRKPRIIRLIAGAFILLGAAVSGAKSENQAPRGLPEVWGSVIGVLITLALAAWLIASGLPKTMGLDESHRRARRRKWYLFAGVGFLISMSLSMAAAIFKLLLVAVLISWLYWFVWTWVAWLLADKLTVQAICTPVEEGLPRRRVSGSWGS